MGRFGRLPGSDFWLTTLGLHRVSELDSIRGESRKRQVGSDSEGYSKVLILRGSHQT